MRLVVYLVVENTSDDAQTWLRRTATLTSIASLIRPSLADGKATQVVQVE